MPIEFTHVPAATWRNEAGAPFFRDVAEAARMLSRLEDAGFNKVVVDDPKGLPANIEGAASVLDSASPLDIAVSHRVTSLEPTAAARQLAALDARGKGRVALRVLGETAGDDAAGAAGHVAAWQRIDEYLVLLKRLWSNERPFDHEGAFYSVKGGFVPRKGSRGVSIDIRLGGPSGTALKVAGRHADVFELAPGSIDEVGRLMARVRAVAAEHGRASKLRFALPVRLGASGYSAFERPAVELADPPARAALTLLSYATLGIEEFMVAGLDSPWAISTAGRETIALVRNSVSRREADRPGLPASDPERLSRVAG